MGWERKLFWVRKGLPCLGIALLCWLSVPMFMNNLVNVLAKNIIKDLSVEELKTPQEHCDLSHQLQHIAETGCRAGSACVPQAVSAHASLVAVNPMATPQPDLLSVYFGGWREWCAGSRQNALARWKTHSSLIGERFYQYGIIASLENDVPTQVAWFEMSVALRPQEPHGLVELGDAYLRANAPAAAAAVYRRAAQADASEARAFAGAAFAMSMLGEMEAAEQSIRQAIALSPTNPVYWKFYGSVLLAHRRDFVGAETWFRRVITVDPQDSRAHNALAVALLWQAKSAEAKLELERSVILADTPQLQSEYFYAYADTLAGMNQPRVALPFYELALAHNPANADYALTLALLYVHVQQCGQAQMVYTRYASQWHLSSAKARDFSLCGL